MFHVKMYLIKSSYKFTVVQKEWKIGIFFYKLNIIFKYDQINYHWNFILNRQDLIKLTDILPPI